MLRERPQSKVSTRAALTSCRASNLPYLMKSLILTFCSIAFLGTSASLSAADAKSASGPLEISAKLENAYVLESEGHVHALVRLKAEKQKSTDQDKRLNLALVIDRSGSMRGTKIEDARDAAIQMLERMRDGDRVALISYSDDVSVDVPSVELDEMSRQRVRNAIHRITDGGSTNLGGGLIEGLDQVEKHAGKADVNRVLLISDGLANRGVQEPKELNRIAREALQKGVITTTIGLGADYNEDLMTGVADHGGGNYYFVKDSDMIAQTLSDEVKQMAATVAKNVALHLTLSEGVGVDTVHGWVLREDGDTIVVPLGEFFSGQTRSVLWRFELPEGAKAGDKIEIGPVKLSFNDLEDAITLQHVNSETLTVSITDDKDLVASAKDMEVAARIAEIELATSMETAANLVAEGKYDEAKAMLGQAVAQAKDRGAGLPGEYQKDLLAAADEAEALQNKVDDAEESAEEAKVFTKGGKASSQMLRKK